MLELQERFNETVNLSLSGPGGGATLGAQGTTSLTIKNNTVDSALRLNELLVDPNGTDNPFEYVEITTRFGCVDVVFDAVIVCRRRWKKSDCSETVCASGMSLSMPP